MHYETKSIEPSFTREQTKQNAQNVNTAMGNLKQGIANKDTVKASENYHDADVISKQHIQMHVSSGKLYYQ